MSKHNDDNHSNQLNPNNDAYWQSRGEDERPDDWEETAEQDEDGWMRSANFRLAVTKPT
ncbi:hypothetical protein [Pseudomonas syringae]|uniref:hypothetical protein n=1 Tax=Pseudomonas syringae TaxID=317 RepID=UPI003F74BCCB